MKLISIHDPIIANEKLVCWRGKRWTASVRRTGSQWSASFGAELVGRAYSSKRSAKVGLERFIRKQANVLADAMGW